MQASVVASASLSLTLSSSECSGGGKSYDCPEGQGDHYSSLVSGRSRASLLPHHHHQNQSIRLRRCQSKFGYSARNKSSNSGSPRYYNGNEAKSVCSVAQSDHDVHRVARSIDRTRTPPPNDVSYKTSDHVYCSHTKQEYTMDDDADDVTETDDTLTVVSCSSSAVVNHQATSRSSPLDLANFKAATGCRDASDFVVRCFVARLRAGIIVVKHSPGRWAKSQNVVLSIHADGQSLTWFPVAAKLKQNKKKKTKNMPKLNLSSCSEVRHAWSRDPTEQGRFTGTKTLRQKCNVIHAHKSFALIFQDDDSKSNNKNQKKKYSSLNITARTEDQCKVLTEGFSALCFRLRVATLGGCGGSVGEYRPMPQELTSF